MGKFIAKTALITVGVVVAITLLCYGFFSLLLPGPFSGFYENIGATDAAISCAERAYKKSENRKDLKHLVDLLAFSSKETRENLEKLSFYGVALCEGKEFITVDCKSYGEKGGDYYLLVTSKTARAIYLSGKKDSAIEKAEEYLENCLSDGMYMYSGSAVRSVLVTSFDKKDSDTVGRLVLFIESLDDSKISEADKIVIENDLKNIKTA